MENSLTRRNINGLLIKITSQIWRNECMDKVFHLLNLWYPVMPMFWFSKLLKSTNLDGWNMNYLPWVDHVFLSYMNIVSGTQWLHSKIEANGYGEYSGVEYWSAGWSEEYTIVEWVFVLSLMALCYTIVRVSFYTITRGFTSYWKWR